MAIREPRGIVPVAKDHLKYLATSSSSKWANEYVIGLGVLEHCDEILTLHRAWSVAKAEKSGKADNLEYAILNELADLWCLLQMRRIHRPSFANRCSKRTLKFRAL